MIWGYPHFRKPPYWNMPIHTPEVYSVLESNGHLLQSTCCKIIVHIKSRQKLWVNPRNSTTVQRVNLLAESLVHASGDKAGIAAESTFETLCFIECHLDYKGAPADFQQRFTGLKVDAYRKIQRWCGACLKIHMHQKEGSSKKFQCPWVQLASLPLSALRCVC